MADEVTTPAEPVSAEPAGSSAPEPTKPEVFEVPSDPKLYEQWRYGNGKPKAESAPARHQAKPKGDAEGDQDAPETVAESEPASKEQERLSKPERRLNELLEDLRRAGINPSELKTLKREQKAAEAAPEKPVADPNEPKEPSQDDFKTWEEYEAAVKKYNRELAKYEASRAVEEYRASQQQESLQKEMIQRVDDAKKRYGAEADTKIVGAAKAIFQDQEIPGAIRQILNESSALVDVLYTIGKSASDLEDFVALCKSNPGAAVRKAVLTERLVMEELAKNGGDGPPRGENGKFVAPDKKTDTAPPPPREVSGRSGPPKDAVERAVETGDFDSYRKEQNRRDLARFRGQ